MRKHAIISESQHKWKTRPTEGGFPDRQFDIDFWQEQGDEAIFQAAWEMVEIWKTATCLKRIWRLSTLS
jgi:hypothetical protein